jgi:hypothetical protein
VSRVYVTDTCDTKDGEHVRERLLALDDANYTYIYNCEEPAFPAKNYSATTGGGEGGKR